jgi:hypothetical protein
VIADSVIAGSVIAELRHDRGIADRDVAEIAVRS